MDATDLLIVGGGVVGCTLASGILQASEHTVALVDANELQRDTLATPGFDARAIALSQYTVEALSQLGITCDPTQCPAVPIEHIVVSDQGFVGKTHLHASDYRLDQFGQVVSINALGKQVLPGPQSRFCLHDKASVTSVSQRQHDVLVTLDNHTQLSTKLLVLADGGRSQLASSLGFKRDQTDYNQTAVIANIEMSQAHCNWAHERFTKQGPLALLPYATKPLHEDSGCGFSVVWTLSSTMANQAVSWSDAEFIDLLQRAIGYRHGRITAVSKRFAYPLLLQQLDSCIRHRVVVVGNGAQSLHPIAGQGFNLGLRDVTDLVAAVNTSQDPGEFSVLNNYRLKRRADKASTIALTDALVRVFSNHYPPLVVGRNLGLMAMEYCHGLSNRFVRQTTGFAAATR